MPASNKAPARIADVDPKVLRDLHAGRREARSLAEWLALDYRKLIRLVVASPTSAELALLDPSIGVSKRMHNAARIVLDRLGPGCLPTLQAHHSDTLRGWAAYVVGLLPDLTLTERLAQIRPLADDANSGVREWAWMGVRSHLAADVTRAIQLLTPWTAEPSANLRRFAIESTRPRGVWSAHITILKQQPELARPLLDPLMSDPHKYVQDSVSNWLNDAAKTSPDWVRQFCAVWLRRRPSAATTRICRRAQRSLS